MSFFNVLKLLFPKSKAFDMTQNTTLRQFVKGLSYLPEDIKTETEKVYLDLFPDTTRALSEWENQFKVLFAQEQYGDTKQEILKALWQSNRGGQTAEYLQSLLRRIVPEIYVTENTPVRNPTDAQSAYTCLCDTEIANCDYAKAVCDYRDGNEGFIPSVIANDVETIYDVLPEESFWEQCFFISGTVIRDELGRIIWIQKIKVERKWKKFIEFLTLKVKPAQMKALLYIEWI